MLFFGEMPARFVIIIKMNFNDENETERDK